MSEESLSLLCAFPSAHAGGLGLLQPWVVVRLTKGPELCVCHSKASFPSGPVAQCWCQPGTRCPVQGRILKLPHSSPQHMVMSFRVSELQVLLGFAGRNKSGRKHELLAKALHLLKSSCAPSVQMKIKELYRRRFPRKTLGPSDLSLLSLPPGTPPVGSPVPLTPMPPALLTPGTLLGPKREVDMHPLLPQPVHPDVTMKPLPFYEVHGELIRPTTLGTALCVLLGVLNTMVSPCALVFGGLSSRGTCNLKWG